MAIKLTSTEVEGSQSRNPWEARLGRRQACRQERMIERAQVGGKTRTTGRLPLQTQIYTVRSPKIMALKLKH
eukprot:1159706-Pelagomonas_calceolata.AAC.9